MTVRVVVDALPVLRLGRHFVTFNIEGGKVKQTNSSKRIEDIPVSEVETTGQQSPIFDRVATGAIPLSGGALPTVPERIQMDEADRLDGLHKWWAEEARKDAEQCLAKLIEYGSSDLDIMAHSMLAVGGKIWEGVPDIERMRIGREMAIGFYLHGKVARAFGAFEHGRMPSDDTIGDIVRYGMMWKRVRETGEWR